MNFLAVKLSLKFADDIPDDFEAVVEDVVDDDDAKGGGEDDDVWEDGNDEGMDSTARSLREASANPANPDLRGLFSLW